MQAAFDGRRIVIFSGGAAKGTEDVLEEIGEIAKGGGDGSIMGRNAFQRPARRSGEAAPRRHGHLQEVARALMPLRAVARVFNSGAFARRGRFGEGRGRGAVDGSFDRILTRTRAGSAFCGGRPGGGRMDDAESAPPREPSVDDPGAPRYRAARAAPARRRLGLAAARPRRPRRRRPAPRRRRAPRDPPPPPRSAGCASRARCCSAPASRSA